MNLLLSIMEHYVPGFIKKRKLAELYQLTFLSFDCPPPDITHLSFTGGLARYASDTKRLAEEYLNRNELSDLEYQRHERAVTAAERRLFYFARRWGRKQRKMLRIKTWTEAAQAMKLMYGLIGIDWHYNSRGDVRISHCYFSDYYSPAVCRLVSCLDDGIAAGLWPGGRLIFRQRITEGCPCCLAHYIKRK